MDKECLQAIPMQMLTLGMPTDINPALSPVLEDFV